MSSQVAFAERQDDVFADNQPEVRVGRVVSVSGAQAIIMLSADQRSGDLHRFARPEMGSVLKIRTPKTSVIGMVSSLSVPIPSDKPDEPEVRIAEVELVGEFSDGAQGPIAGFQRGVSVFPSLGDTVFSATRDDLQAIYTCSTGSIVRVGSIAQDSSIPAFVMTDDLLGKHFAILGATGSGKSCAVALMLKGILRNHPNAHIVLLDPHDEYRSSFADQAEYITPDKLPLPYWLLTFEELAEVLVGSDGNREVEMEILRQLIPTAKDNYKSVEAEKPTSKIRKGSTKFVSANTEDTPRPYRLSDVLYMIDQSMGKLDRPENLAPYRRLKARIEMLMADPRYAFMFGSLTVRDTMAETIGLIFRIPVANKPVSLIDLSRVPSEIINVVVSVLCRLAFDLALWSNCAIPITIVCEEAHRYVPQDSKLGFEPTKRALSKIAKEGRKYGVSLCVVSQRPAELAPTILSQCNTIFALRLTNDNDQAFVRSAISDSAVSLLEFLPSMGNAEAIAFGEGVSLPMRINFDQLPATELPMKGDTKFSTRWNLEIDDQNFLAEVIDRWRSEERSES